MLSVQELLRFYVLLTCLLANVYTVPLPNEPSLNDEEIRRLKGDLHDFVEMIFSCFTKKTSIQQPSSLPNQKQKSPRHLAERTPHIHEPVQSEEDLLNLRIFVDRSDEHSEEISDNSEQTTENPNQKYFENLEKHLEEIGLRILNLSEPDSALRKETTISPLNLDNYKILKKKVGSHPHNKKLNDDTNTDRWITTTENINGIQPDEFNKIVENMALRMFYGDQSENIDSEPTTNVNVLEHITQRPGKLTRILQTTEPQFEDDLKPRNNFAETVTQKIQITPDMLKVLKQILPKITEPQDDDLKPRNNFGEIATQKIYKIPEQVKQLTKMSEPQNEDEEYVTTPRVQLHSDVLKILQTILPHISESRLEDEIKPRNNFEETTTQVVFKHPDIIKKIQKMFDQQSEDDLNSKNNLDEITERPRISGDILNMIKKMFEPQIEDDLKPRNNFEETTTQKTLLSPDILKFIRKMVQEQLDDPKDNFEDDTEMTTDKLTMKKKVNGPQYEDDLKPRINFEETTTQKIRLNPDKLKIIQKIFGPQFEDGQTDTSRIEDQTQTPESNEVGMRLYNENTASTVDVSSINPYYAIHIFGENKDGPMNKVIFEGGVKLSSRSLTPKEMNLLNQFVKVVLGTNNEDISAANKKVHDDGPVTRIASTKPVKKSPWARSAIPVELAK